VTPAAKTADDGFRGLGERSVCAPRSSSPASRAGLVLANFKIRPRRELSGVQRVQLRCWLPPLFYMDTSQSPAWIVISKGASPIRCKVSGMTATGGYIAVAPEIEVPQRFALYTSFRTRRGRPCRVTGQQGGNIEFVFLPTKSEEARRLANAAAHTRGGPRWES
jgi:hypothetical protein